MVKVIEKTRVVGITWIYCPEHDGVRGNKEADRLTLLAPIGDQRLHDMKEWRKSEKTENVYVDMMSLVRVARGSGRHLSLQEKN
jgi:hypothetical protein